MSNQVIGFKRTALVAFFVLGFTTGTLVNPRAASALVDQASVINSIATSLQSIATSLKSIERKLK